MTSIFLILFGSVLMGFSGMPACLLSSSSKLGQRIAVVLMLLGSLAGLAGTALCFLYGSNSLDAEWFLPWGSFSVSVDAMSAFFLGLTFLVPVLGSFYGLGYWKQNEHKENGQKLGLSYGVLAGSMVLVTIARDGILFLLAWEIMALSAYFAATAEDDNPEVRRAGWIYLIATHTGTLILFAMFTYWAQITGSFALNASIVIPSQAATAIFILAIIGFGFKAGFMPLHIWLPGAHANAPSHVSAVMSGVMLKMGIYGILRMTSLLPIPSAWWGSSLLIIGAVTGIGGIAFAIGQRDIKRLLAYSSIENIGIITMGLGLALLGRFLGRTDWIFLGLGGSLLHVWNHGLFKPLLFLNAGSVIHATGTRDMELLGGLGKKMPKTMAFFAIGAVAICALPPLNGFVSEWLLYLGFFRSLLTDTLGAAMFAPLSAVALSIIGALALACFVKVFAIVFLGESRSPSGIHAHDPSPIMLAPIFVLASGCIVIGFYPRMVLGLLEAAIHSWGSVPDPGLTLEFFAPGIWISVFGISLILFIIFLLILLKRKRPNNKTVQNLTWDCGYAKPQSSMQYTGSSFIKSISDLFGFLLLPHTERPKIEGAFPQKSKFQVIVPDIILDRIIMPIANFINKNLIGIRVFQQGQTHAYILYVVVITVILLLFGGLRG